MMFVHEYFNFHIAHRWRVWSPRKWAESIDRYRIGVYIPFTLLIWDVAHAYTFSLDPAYQVFCAAELSILLGYLYGVSLQAKAPARA